MGLAHSFMRSISLPRTNGVLLLSLLTVALLYFGRLFLIPLAFAVLLAMLLTPVSGWLERRGVSRGWAALLCLLLVLVFIGALAGLVAAQGSNIAEEWPPLKAKLFQEVSRLQQEVQERFGVAPQKQTTLVREQLAKVSDSVGKFASTAVKGLLGTVGGLVLVLLYLFFLLWQRSKFRDFALQLTQPESRAEAGTMLDQISKVAGNTLSAAFCPWCFWPWCTPLAFPLLA